MAGCLKINSCQNIFSPFSFHHNSLSAFSFHDFWVCSLLSQVQFYLFSHLYVAEVLRAITYLVNTGKVGNHIATGTSQFIFLHPRFFTGELLNGVLWKFSRLFLWPGIVMIHSNGFLSDGRTSWNSKLWTKYKIITFKVMSFITTLAPDSSANEWKSEHGYSPTCSVVWVCA